MRSEKERVRSDNYYLGDKAHSGRPIEFDEALLIVLDGNVVSNLSDELLERLNSTRSLS